MSGVRSGVNVWGVNVGTAKLAEAVVKSTSQTALSMSFNAE